MNNLCHSISLHFDTNQFHFTVNGKALPSQEIPLSQYSYASIRPVFILPPIAQICIPWGKEKFYKYCN